MVSGIDGADYTVREMLIEMRGTVNRTADDVASIRTSQESLDRRVTKLEGDRLFERGSKQGFERGVRVIYALASVCGLGGIAAALKVLLPHLGAG